MAIAHDGQPPRLVLDAGSGVRHVTSLLAGQPFRGTVILSHLHWDHLQGLPFFSAADRPDADVTLLMPEQGPPAIELLTRIMSPPFFPIRPSDLGGRWSVKSYDEGPRRIEGFDVLACEIPHGGGRTMGLRVSDGRSCVAYLPDHGPQALGRGEDGLGPVHDAALALASGADLLIHDAQFTAEEIPERGHYGHAAAGYAVELAARCDVPRVLLFHHDPHRTDDELDVIVAGLRRSSSLAIIVPRQGETFDL